MATISIADNDARVQYTQAVTANTTQLTIDFPFFSLDDINVIVTSAAGVDTTLTRGTGTGTFAVVGTSVDDGFSGGHITLGDTYSDAATKFTIFRDITVERTTDFPTSGPFNVSALNTELDKIFAIEQELETKIGRTMKLADSDTAASLTLPNLDTRKGKTLAFNNTTGLPEAGPSIADVQTVSSASADIATLADIEDGTDATDAIQTVAGISANVTTVAGISSNVSTVAGISANVTTVAGNNSNVTTVASNISSVNTVASNITDVIAVANDLAEATSEIVTVADDLNEAVSEIDTVANSITNVDAVGTNIANVNTVAGISSNVTTVAGVSSDVTTVAGVSGNVTTVAGIASDVTTVAADGTDIGTVAGISSNVSTVAGISANVTTVAGVSSDVTAVAGISANVTTVANNVAGVNSFADRYRIGSSNPTTSLDEGDLFFNTTDNELKVYNGSSWVAASSSVNGTSVRQTYTVGTASGGYDGSTTVFPITYDVGFVDVYLNGVRLAGSDFTATNGTSVTLGSAAASGDTVDMVAFGIFNVAAISAAALTSGTIPDARFPATLPAVSGANLTGINTDLVADTTPQLGGNLDVQTHSIVSTSNQDITITPDGTGNVVMNTDNLQIIESADSASQAPNLDLRRISSSPADNDILGAVRFYGKDSAGNDELYGKISVEAEDVTNTIESSSMYFEAQPDCRMQLYRPNISNKFLYFLDEQILHWDQHKGTNYFCRLFWETPTQSNNLSLPNVQSGTLSHVALSTTTITSATSIITIDNLPDEFDTFQFFINAHPVTDNVSFRSRFLNASGVAISSANTYGFYRDTDGGGTSVDNETFIQLTGNSIGNSDHEGVVANLTLQGRNFDGANLAVVPPVIHGNIVGHYTTSVASGGSAYGCMNDNVAMGIRGIQFYFSSGDVEKATVQVFGIQNT
jgi:hypothetical protein